MTVAPPRPAAPASRRADPLHYTPADLPAEFAAFETPVEGLGVGSAGKVGLLELTFAPLGGATRITHHFQQFPLQVFRPFYLDPHRPAMAFVYMLSHGGTLQGDRARLDLVCAPGASVHVTTQAAAKLYRMERNYATQLVNLEAGEDSFLEYLPDPVIPFRDSRFFTRTQLTVHPSATAILGETLLPGRVAYGEHHDYALYASQLEARSPEGELLFTDSLKFAPQRAPLHSPGQLGPHAAVTTLYVVTRQVPAGGLADRLHARLLALPGVVGGASELPNGSGAWGRVFGPDSISVSGALRALWDEARLALTGAPAPQGRKT
jgi:urease accessory protein